MEMTPGTVIDQRYRIDGELGRGGMAVVYKVRHLQLDTLLALKLLTIHAKSVQTRLIQEGRVQAALRHPNIVAVTDVVVVDGMPGLVMEFVDGPPMDEFLRRRSLTVEQADQIAHGVLNGVAAAHAHGIIHRDLKPANVMLAVTAQGLVPKVADFGLVKVLEDDEGVGGGKTKSGVAMGTPAYMAPEQFDDAKNVDKRADVFSLGAILYELVSGQRAYSGDTMFDIYKKIAEQRRTPLDELVPDVPERMLNAVRGALAVKRDDRIPDIETLRAIWSGQATQATDAAQITAGPWDADALGLAREMSAGSMSSEEIRSSLRGSGVKELLEQRSHSGVSMPSQPPPMEHVPGPSDASRTEATFYDDADFGGGPPTQPSDASRTAETFLEDLPDPAQTASQDTIYEDEPTSPDPVPAPAPAPVPDPPAEEVADPEPPPEPEPEPAAPASPPVPPARSAGSGMAMGLMGLVMGGLGVVVLALLGVIGFMMMGTSSPDPDPEPAPVAAAPAPALPEGRPPSKVKPRVTNKPKPDNPKSKKAKTSKTSKSSKSSKQAAPAPSVTAAPEPAPPEPAAAVAPEPAPAPAGKPPEVYIRRDGLIVSIVDTRTGRPVDENKLVPGTYRFDAYFDPAKPTEVATKTLAAGDIWKMTCSRSRMRCSIKKE